MYRLLIFCLLACGLWLLALLPLHPGMHYTLDQASRWQARGFYAAEQTAEGRGFRWGDGYGKLIFAPQGSGPALLTLHGMAPPPHTGPVPVTLRVNERYTLRLTMTHTARRFAVLVPSDTVSLFENGVVVESPVVYAAEERSPRRLGVVLFEVGWHAMHPQPWLPLLQATVALLVLGTGWLVLRRQGWALRWQAGWLMLFAVLLLLAGYAAPAFAVRWHLLLLLPLIGLLAGLALMRGQIQQPAIRHMHTGAVLLVLLALLVLGIGWHVALVPLVLLAGLALVAGVPPLCLTQRDWWAAQAQRYTLPVLALLVFAGALTFFLNCSYTRCAFTIYTSPPLRSDALGYYAYLPAALLDHDLTMQTRMQLLGEPVPGTYHVPETGQLLNKYPIGVALLTLPFFVVGHVLSIVFGQPLDGHAPLYQMVAGLAGPVYAVLGLVLLERLLRREVPHWIALVTLVCILPGTNLYNYATLDASYSHAFSFFLITLLLYLVPLWYERPTLARTCGLALVCGLIVLVRNTNGIAWLFVPLYGVTTWAAAGERLRWLWHRRGRVLLAAGLVLLLLLPQLFYWHAMSGRWLLNAYGSEGLHYWRKPQIWGVLFGIQRGLFVWSPVLLLSLPGLWLMLQRRHPLIVPLLLVLLLVLYITASWHDQSYGAAYGPRVLVDWLALLALPLALWLASLRGRVLRGAALALCCLLVMLSVGQTYKYWQGIVDEYNPTWAEYTRSPW
jgi:hypothetical protein